MHKLRSPDGAFEVITDEPEEWPGFEVLDDDFTPRAPCPFLDCGPAHFARIAPLVYAEALLVASGVTLSAGFLFEDARVSGQSIESLAAEILAGQLGPVIFETNRRAAVRAHQSDQSTGDE